MKILVATDLTSRSDRAVARAFLLAEKMKGTLTIVYVVDADLPDELRAHTIEWAQQLLSVQTERLSATTGVIAALNVIVGYARTDIARLAESDAVDLIVLGIYDVRAKKLFAKTTGSAILRSGLTPALIVKCAATSPYKQAVLGVDLASSSQSALRQMIHIAPQACVSLVHAYHIPFQAFLGSPAFRKQFADGLQLQTDAFTKSVMDFLPPQADLSTIIEEGEPSGVIRGVCERIGANLVTIGSPRPSGIFRAIGESPIAGLLRQPPCDVLVIPPS